MIRIDTRTNVSFNNLYYCHNVTRVCRVFGVKRINEGTWAKWTTSLETRRNEKKKKKKEHEKGNEQTLAYQKIPMNKYLNYPREQQTAENRIQKSRACSFVFHLFLNIHGASKSAGTHTRGRMCTLCKIEPKLPTRSSKWENNVKQIRSCFSVENFRFLFFLFSSSFLLLPPLLRIRVSRRIKKKKKKIKEWTGRTKRRWKKNLEKEWEKFPRQR